MVIQQEVEKQKEDLAELRREVRNLRENVALVQTLQVENEQLKTRQVQVWTHDIHNSIRVAALIFILQIEQSHAELNEQLQSCSAEMETLKTTVKALTERTSAHPVSLPAIDANVLVPLLEPFVLERTRVEAQDALRAVTTSLQETLDKAQEDLYQTMWVQLRPTFRLVDAIQSTVEQAKRANHPLGALIPALERTD